MEREDPAVTLRIIDEVIFTLVSLDALRRLNIMRLDQLREHIRRNGISEFADAMNDAKELRIIDLEDKGSLGELLEAIKSYNPSPGDVLIAITARHYGIYAILTFDEDFKRIPRLKVIP
jgi:predicted nucleic acid-binding protein